MTVFNSLTEFYTLRIYLIKLFAGMNIQNIIDMNEWCKIPGTKGHTHDQMKFRHVQTNEKKNLRSFITQIYRRKLQI